MITKILVTLCIVVIGWLFIQKQRRSDVSSSISKTQQQHHSKRVAKVAYIFIAVVMLLSALLFYFEYQRSQRIMTISVVNTLTGDRTSYQSRRGDIEGHRFITTDGVDITIADNERLEIQGSN